MGRLKKPINWPPSMLIILQKYFDIQQRNGDCLDDHEKDAFTKEMRQAYDLATYTEKFDVLVPRDGKYLLSEAIHFSVGGGTTPRFSIHYDMPDNDGYIKDPKYQPPQIASLQIGEKYDRIGSPNGRYLSRLLNGKAQSLSSRALPYYIPEEDFTKNPAYHLYAVSKTYRGIEPDCDFNIKYALTQGTVAPAFDESGLGEQTVIPKTDDVASLIDGGYLT